MDVQHNPFKHHIDRLEKAGIDQRLDPTVVGSPRIERFDHLARLAQAVRGDQQVDVPAGPIAHPVVPTLLRSNSLEGGNVDALTRQ